MKIKSVLFLALTSCYLCSCLKDNKDNCSIVSGSPSATEVANLRNFINTNGIPATEDPRGFFYRVTFAGTGTETPVSTDSVVVTYKGTLTDGTVFDSTANGTTAKFLLTDLITGWQLGIPLIKKNGVIDLYLPPAHGYACRAIGIIPASATTIFHIELKDF